MKSTEAFKKIIQAHLDSTALSDALFAVSLTKKNKNIDDCINYIFNTVKQSNCNGFTDEEIFGMAVHYYDEDNINVGNSINCKVVVNQVIELSDDERSQARKIALEQAIAQERDKIMKKAAPKPASLAQLAQPTLF